MHAMARTQRAQFVVEMNKHVYWYICIRPHGRNITGDNGHTVP